MESLTSIFDQIGMILPAILMGAAIPCCVLLLLLFSKKRKETAFKAVLYGFGTFFFVLLFLGIALILFSQSFLTAITISSESDADVYVLTGGVILLLLFYLGSEALKQASYRSVLKSERKSYGGLTFGSGFILAQNLLIFVLIYTGEIDWSQAMVFGLLMLISSVIYLLVSVIGYQLAMEKHYLSGSAVALSYYLMFAVMLLFSNVYVTYGFIAAVLAFNLVIAYFVLPLPFKRKKENLT